MDGTYEEIAGNRYLRAMLDSLTDMIRVVTREGRIAYTNREYEERLAGGRDVRGSFCYELYGGTELCDPCISREVIDTGKTRRTTRRMNGRVYSMTASPLVDEDTGEIRASIEVYRDVTLDTNIRDNLLNQTTKLRSDLVVAHQVQHSLVKGVLPEIDGYTLFAEYAPCEAVGGDVYDVFLSGNKLVMYLADVSGHGVTPAMLAVFFSRAIRAASTMRIEEPARMLSYVQSEFEKLRVDPTIYVTGFVVVLDIETGIFQWSNAGLSVVPVQYHDGRITELFMSSPPVSHWFENPDFGQKEGKLEPGDRLLIYSDGLCDVQCDPAVEKRLNELFSARDFKCDDFVRTVLRDLHPRPTDDLTVLLCVRDSEA